MSRGRIYTKFKEQVFPGISAIFLLSSGVLLSQPGLATAKKILVLGDSLTEGLGVAKESSFPEVLQKKFVAAGRKDVEVIGAGIGGSTTASGLSRLRWHLKAKPSILVLALGANDGLRGLKIQESRKNLEQVITTAKKENITVVLAGMRMPPNYGKSY